MLNTADAPARDGDEKAVDHSKAEGAASLPPKVREQWSGVQQAIEALAIQVHQAARSFAFAFVEGTLVRALRDGHWVLLDEVNLATSETLECLNSVLDSETGTVSLEGKVFMSGICSIE